MNFNGIYLDEPSGEKNTNRTGVEFCNQMSKCLVFIAVVGLLVILQQHMSTVAQEVEQLWV